MNENYRHRQLLNLLAQKQQLSTTEITQLLAISPATARRDITKLHEQGWLRKVRNGAEAIVKSEKKRSAKVQSGKTNEINNVSEKQRIAKAAAMLCQEGDSVILTCGSTMLMLGDSLCGRDVQIITNFLPLANHLIEHNHDNVVIMGGQYNKNQAITLSLGTHAEAMYAANIMFTSGKGITAEGLYKNDMLIANSEQRMIANVGKLVVLMDSTKLGQQVGMLFCEASRIATLITGKEADEQILNALRKQNVEIILA